MESGDAPCSQIMPSLAVFDHDWLSIGSAAEAEFIRHICMKIIIIASSVIASLHLPSSEVTPSNLETMPLNRDTSKTTLIDSNTSQPHADTPPNNRDNPHTSQYDLRVEVIYLRNTVLNFSSWSEYSDARDASS